MESEKNIVECKITKKEVDELEYLSERLNSLNILKEILCGNKESHMQEDTLYPIVVNELEKIKKSSTMWWDSIRSIYNLNKKNPYRVDGVTREVYLVECSRCIIEKAE